MMTSRGYWPSVFTNLGVRLEPRTDGDVGSNNHGVDQEGSHPEPMEEGV